MHFCHALLSCRFVVQSRRRDHMYAPGGARRFVFGFRSRVAVLPGKGRCRNARSGGGLHGGLCAAPREHGSVPLFLPVADVWLHGGFGGLHTPRVRDKPSAPRQRAALLPAPPTSCRAMQAVCCMCRCLFRHLFRHLSRCLSRPLVSGTCPTTYPVICSGICSGVCSGVCAGVCPGHLSDYLSGHLFRYLCRCLFRRLFWCLSRPFVPVFVPAACTECNRWGGGQEKHRRIAGGAQKISGFPDRGSRDLSDR